MTTFRPKFSQTTDMLVKCWLANIGWSHFLHVSECRWQKIVSVPLACKNYLSYSLKYFLLSFNLNSPKKLTHTHKKRYLTIEKIIFVPCPAHCKRNYFMGYGILLPELPVFGCTFQCTNRDLPTSNKCREVHEFSREVIPLTPVIKISSFAVCFS